MHLVNRTIDAAPVHVHFRGGFFDGEFVERRAARVLAGSCHKRTVRGKDGFVAADGGFVEHGRAQVPVDASGPGKTKRFKAVRPLNLCAHLKAPCLQRRPGRADVAPVAAMLKGR